MVETSTRVEGRVFTHSVGWVLEHLKHPLKTVDRYWSPVSDRGQMASSGDVVTPYIPIMAMWRVTRFYFHFSFLVLMIRFSFRMEWWMALYRRGPPIWWTAIGHTAPASFSFLDLECTRQSSGRLLGHFQINYPRSSPIIGMRRCVEPAP